MNHRVFPYALIAVLVGCGGEAPNPAPPPMPTATAMPTTAPMPVASASTAPTPTAPPAVQPDTPQGSDAERDAALTKDSAENFEAFGNTMYARTRDRVPRVCGP